LASNLLLVSTVKQSRETFASYCVSNIKNSIISYEELLRKGVDVSIEDYHYILIVLDRVENSKCHAFSRDGGYWINKDNKLPPGTDYRYYREYTVPTRYIPNKSSNIDLQTFAIDKELLFEGVCVKRGAKRLVISGREKMTNVYYTCDHYSKLVKISK
jgi:guanyl-specific ribonuclease Sa